MSNMDFVVPITNPDIDTIIINEPHSLIPPQPFSLAGGKGFNIIRALRILEQPLKVVALVSDDQAQFFQNSLEDLGIEGSKILPLLQETRLCQTEIDAIRGYVGHDSIPRRSVLNDPSDWECFLQEASKLFPNSVALLLAGKLPEKAPEDAYARCISLAKEHGLFTTLDTRGRLLKAALGEAPDLIKPNIVEVQEAMGIAENDEAPLDSLLDFAYELLKQGAKCVAVSGGPKGALLVDKNGYTRYYVPPQSEKNPVGSGDTMVAVTAHYHVTKGYRMEDAVQMGVAYGAAQVHITTPGEYAIEQANLLSGRIEVSGRRFGPSLIRPEISDLAQFSPNARFLSVANRDPRFRLDDSIREIKPREDRAIVTPKCIVIADGITLNMKGPYRSPSPSAEASRTLCEVISNVINSLPANEEINPEKVLRAAFKKANEEIFFLNQLWDEKEYEKFVPGGAVGIAALIHDGSLHVMHIGDASVILVTDASEAIRITKPQDLITNAHLESVKLRFGEDVARREKETLRNLPPGAEEGRAYGVISGELNSLLYLEYISHSLAGIKHVVFHTDGFDSLSDETIVAFANGKITHQEIILQKNGSLTTYKRAKSSDDRTIIVLDIK